MDIGDVCMYEFIYNGTNNEFKLWITAQKNTIFTIVDGMRDHPWLN